MATDIFVWIFLGIIQMGTAIYGGIVSVRPKNRDNRGRNIGVFALLGIMGAILIIYSGVRTYDAQKSNEGIQERLRQQVQDTNNKLSQSLMSQEYMKGQLNSIGTLMTRIGEKTTDPALGLMANTISKLAGNTAKEKREEIHNSGRKTDSALIHKGRGMLTGMIMTPNPNKQCTIQAHDGLDKSGVAIGEPMRPEIGNSQTFGGTNLHIPFAKGLYISMNGCVSYTVEYVPRD